MGAPGAAARPADRAGARVRASVREGAAGRSSPDARHGSRGDVGTLCCSARGGRGSLSPASITRGDARVGRRVCA
eukprot:1834294-Lingulodinium_polyedra.AAC.1